MDMERRTVDLAKHRAAALSPVGRYAYVGDLDEGTKRALRAAVSLPGSRESSYASPEALVTGLSSSVLRRAEAGLLRQVVIDELATSLISGATNSVPSSRRSRVSSAVHKPLLRKDLAPLSATSATLAERHIGIRSEGSRERVKRRTLSGAPNYEQNPPPTTAPPSRRTTESRLCWARFSASSHDPLHHQARGQRDVGPTARRCGHRPGGVHYQQVALARLSSVIRRWRGDDDSGTSVGILSLAPQHLGWAWTCRMCAQ